VVAILVANIGRSRTKPLLDRGEIEPQESQEPSDA
jgi:hypothetical protein